MDLISSSLLKASLKHLRAGLTFDCRNQHQEAVLAYMEGASLLMRLSREEGLDSNTKQFLKSKCHLYLDRIQLIKVSQDEGKELIVNTAIDRNHPKLDGVEDRDEQLIQSLLHIPFQCSMEEVPAAAPVKEFLWKNVILPMMFPGFPGSVTRVKRGILLYGLPGSGKTVLLSALASAVSCPFFYISVPELIWRCHGTEHMLQRVKSTFAIAQLNKPCILCLDDFDMLCIPDLDIEDSLTRKAKNEIMSQLRNASLVTVIAAIQKPWYMDGNLRRRFDRKFYLSLPACTERVQIITHLLAGVKHQLSGDDLERLGHLTSGFSVDDLRALVRICCAAVALALQTATHFRKVTFTPAGSGSEKSFEMMAPCEPQEPGAVGITWEFLNPERVQRPPITMATVERELQLLGRGCSDADLQKMNQWREEFDQED